MKGKESVSILKDDNNLHHFLLEGCDIALSQEFPHRIKSTDTKIKLFKKNYSYYRKMPNDFLRSIFERGDTITDNPKGIKWTKDAVSFRGLGEISIERPTELSNITRLQLSEDGFVLYGMKKFKPRKKFKPQVHNETNLNERKKNDDILYHLMVNQVHTELGEKRFWKLYDIIKYFREHPELTRRDLEKMGVRSDKVWDLIVDFDPALSVWIKAGHKPKDTPNYFHSNNLVKQRDKPLRRMPDAISDNDIDKGNLKGQSYESEVFASSASSKFHFFS